MKLQRIIMYSCVLGALAIVGTLVYRSQQSPSVILPDTSHACTTEAKICPDGSSVGRSGPQCEFAACPSGDASFEKTGVVTAQATDGRELKLVYEEPGKPALTKILSFDSASMCSSPEATTACDAFNAPLSVAFGGKRVRVVGADQGTHILVHRLETVSDTATPSRVTIKTKLNEPASGLNATITPLEVTEDSRCPQDVQCVWAGTVKVRSTLTLGTLSKEVVFERGSAISTDESFITLTGVMPEKNAGAPISPADYRFTFEITTRTDPPAGR